MEFRNNEIEAIVEVVVQKEVAELSDLQLALVGGGIGETAI